MLRLGNIMIASICSENIAEVLSGNDDFYANDVQCSTYAAITTRLLQSKTYIAYRYADSVLAHSSG